MHYSQHQPATGKSVYSWHGSLSNRKITLMNDFHRALLKLPQIPLSYIFFFTFLYIVCCHGNTASAKLAIKII